MALLPEDMGCAGTDPAGDMAVQRISERREKEKGTGIPEAVPRDDTVSVGSTEVLEEFAEQVLSEDVKSFVTVFVTAKKSGGDMIGIIRNTANQIGDKIEVKREIDTMLAAKKYEFQIMSVVPYGIIGYMSLSFPEFMNELYGNMAGIGVMTLCLGIYAGAYYLGIRILRIDV